MSVYLFATVAGGILLVASLFHHAHDDDSPLQLRTITYFLAFGGVTGMLLERVTETGVLMTAAAASGVGLAAGAMAYAVGVVGRARGNPIEIVGREAKVLVPFAKGSRGRIRVNVENKDIDLIATCDEGDVEEGREVLIVSAKNGEAKVTLTR